MAIITLKNDALTVKISTMGAELQSVCDANGVERIFDANPTWWKQHAPVLFPVAGGLRDDEYLLGGKAYHMPKHGFAKLREFELESSTDTTFFIRSQSRPLIAPQPEPISRQVASS